MSYDYDFVVQIRADDNHSFDMIDNNWDVQVPIKYDDYFGRNVLTFNNIKTYCSQQNGTVPTIDGDYTGLQTELNVWTHVAITYIENKTRVFENGKLVYTTERRLPIEYPITFGGSRNNGYWYVVADIDDFCIVKDKALWNTDFKVPDYYLGEVKRMYVSESDTVWGAIR